MSKSDANFYNEFNLKKVSLHLILFFNRKRIL